MSRSVGKPLLGRQFIQHLREPMSLGSLSLTEWDAVLRVARRTNLLGRLAKGVSSTGLLSNLPEVVRVHVESALILVAHQRAAIEWETRHISQALSGFTEKVVLLKGAAYASSGLKAAEGRLFGDVDILVPKNSINQAEAALMLRGWTTGENDPYDERYYRKWMHEIPPMTHRKRGTVIDLHHNILPQTARSSPNPAFLLEASRPLAGSTFHVLSPVDMIIHSATHLLYESEVQNGLRDVFDLDALLTEFASQSANFWDELTERAILLGLAKPVALALRITSNLLQTSSPLSTRQALEDAAGLTAVQLYWLDVIYMRALMPDHPLSRGTGDGTARLAVYLRGHVLRMPAHLLVFHLGRKFLIRLFKNTSRVG